MLVKNWTQVYKSLAVWLPILASTLLVFLEQAQAMVDLPLWSIPIVVAITGVLGWIKEQPSIKKGSNQ